MKKQLLNIKNTIVKGICYSILGLSALSLETNAQTLAGYTFGVSSGTFTPLVAPTATSLGLAEDDAMSAAFGVGFNFIYGGTTVTQVMASSNGQLLFGTGKTQTTTNNLSTTTASQRPGVAPLWDDLLCTAGVTYQTSGSAPNRVLTVEWLEMRWNYQAAGPVISFQVKLYETTNLIEIVYRQDATGYSAGSTGGATIGIMGSASGDFMSVTSTTTPTISTTTSKNDHTVKPANGAIYTFGPPPPMVYSASDVMTFTPAPVGQGKTNSPVVALKVTTTGITNPLSATSIDIGTLGTTSLANISNLKVYYTGTNTVFSATTQFGSTVATPGATNTVTGTQQLAQGDNYFWVTYDVSPTATIGSNIDAEVTSVTVGGTPQTPTTTAPAGNRIVTAPLTGTFSVGAGQTYTTLTAALSALNGLGVSGPVTFNLTDPAYNTTTGETLPFLINPIDGTSPTKNVTIRPATGNTVTILDSIAGELFTLNGTKYLTIDGRQGGSGTPLSLILRNKHVSGGAVTLLNDAISNKLQYAVLMGAATVPTIGVVNLNGGLVTGNDSNMISNCDIGGDTIASPASLIQSAGSTDATMAKYNSHNTVTNCNLFNFWNATGEANAFKISNGTTNWTITGNSIYQTSVNGRSSSSGYYSFNFQNSSNLNALNGNVVTNNYIGGSAPMCGGTPWKQTSSAATLVSYFNLGNLQMTRVSNNTFANINIISTSTSTTGSGAWNAIQFVNGMMNIDSNIIGSLTDSNSIVLKSGSAGVALPISCIASNTPGVYSIRGNKIGGIKVDGGGTVANTIDLIKITSATNTITYDIENNMLGNDVPNNIVAYFSTSTSAQSIRGINNTSSANLRIKNNVIHNFLNLCTVGSTASQVWGIISTSGRDTILNNTIDSLTSLAPSGTGSGSALIGISYTSTTGGSLISENKIFALSSRNPASAVQIAGIYYSGGTNDVISRNIVHSIASVTTSVTAQHNGILFAGGTTRVVNNIVRLGIDADGSAVLTTPIISGINKTGGAIRMFHNSIYVGGTGIGTGTAKTYAFIKTASGVDSVYNNVFANERSNASTGGTHFAISLNNSTTYSAGNNVYWANGTGDTLGSFNNVSAFTMNAFKALSSVDLSSGFGNPNFILATGNAATLDMHISTSIATPVENTGIAVAGVDDDYFGQLRSTATPIDIGAQGGNFIAKDVFSPVVTVITPLLNTASILDRTFVVNITDKTGIPNTSNKPILYYKKMAAGTPNMAIGTRTSGNAQNGNWSFTVSSGTMGGVALNDSVYYYLAVQDSASPNNLGSYPAGIVGTDVTTITTEPVNQAYKILPSLSGALTVGGTGTYPTLTGAGGAFEAINNGVLSGDVTLSIVSDITEPGTVALNQFVEEGGSYSLSIVPDAAVERLIVGSVATTGLIRLNGADKVKFDGRFGGTGRFLRFRNRTASGTTFILQNDAHRDTITYCFIEGINNTTGMILFGSASTGTGNDSNGVNNCVIRDTLGTISSGGVPNTGISSSGAAGFENSENTIANNDIFNFGFNGINLNTTGTGDNWKISNNTFYETASRANSYKVILVSGGNNHLINNNSIGGAAADRSGTPMTTTTTSTTCYTGILLNAPVGSTGYMISNNTIANIFANSGGNDHSFVGIDMTGPSGTITGNTIGGAVNPYDTIRSDGDSKGIRCNGAGTVIVSNNKVAFMTNQSTGNDYLTAIEGSAGVVSIINNTINDITQMSTTSPTYYLACTGISFSTSTVGNAITGNTIYNIVNRSNSNAGTYAVGIGHLNGVGTIIRSNRVYSLGATNTTTGALATIVLGIGVSSGTPVVTNNQITLGDNAINENRVIGIRDETANAVSYLFNSVFINGNTSAGANNSYGMFRTSTGAFAAVNNLVYNKRTTAGTGKSYAVGSTNPVTTANFNYNMMFVNDTAALADIGSIAFGWTALNNMYTLSYNTNWAENTATVPAEQLFIDTAVSNLGIVTTNPSCWYVNGKGIRIVGQTADFDNASVRSESIAGGAVDIGSDEFTPTGAGATPPLASESAAPALNATSVYTFASRPVAAVTYGATGTVPSALTVRYYSGVNPSNTFAGSTFMNTYWNMQATGGAGYTYTLSLMEDSAVLGTTGAVADLKIARYQGTGTLWSRSVGTNVDAAAGRMTATGLSTFGIFTGTDGATNPLPVELLSFKASAMNDDVLLSWTTASEMDNEGFMIERSLDGKNFEDVHFVKGNGTSNLEVSYKEMDLKAFEQAGANTLYYRLRQQDFSGETSVSGVVSVNRTGKELASLDVYPNPFNDNVTMSVVSAEAGSYSVSVVDIQGKEVSQLNVNMLKGMNKISISELANLKAGIYFVKLSGAETMTFKLVKTN